ncbi:hypothetical protein QE152_g40680, partial [Popillia japonica]
SYEKVCYKIYTSNSQCKQASFPKIEKSQSYNSSEIEVTDHSAFIGIMQHHKTLQDNTNRLEVFCIFLYMVGLPSKRTIA